VRQIAAHPADERGVHGRLDDDGPHVRVGQDPVHLVGRRRLVDRHPDRPRGPDREVDDGPLVPGAGHDRDSVARVDAARDEPLRDRGHLVGERAGRHRRPAAVEG
jgi:hypothetical protein